MLFNHQVIKQGDEVKSFMSGLVRMLSDSQHKKGVHLVTWCFCCAAGRGTTADADQ